MKPPPELPDEAMHALFDFVASPAARRLARSWRSEPAEHFSDIYFGLRTQCQGRTIRDARAWVFGNARFHLRNALKASRRRAVVQASDPFSIEEK